MTDLPEPVPYSSLTALAADNILPAFAGIKPGWYRSTDLLARYNAWAESVGCEPITTKTLGEAIARLGAERRYVHGHVAVWNFTPEMVRA